MNKKHDSLNKVLVKLFSDILKIEEKCLCTGAFSNLTITEFHTIETIGSHRERTMSETAKALKITSGTLTTGIDNLVKKGYVKRGRSDADKRKVVIKLSDKGEKALESHNAFHKDLVEHTLSELEPEQERVLVKALFNVDSYFRKKYKL
jgi:DNA-binding MarR family transcriptional regulator